MRQATGLGRDRLRTAMREAGLVTPRTGASTPTGKRPRVLAADRAAAGQAGTGRPGQRLRPHRSEGFTLTFQGTTAGRSNSHWARWLLDRAESS